MAARCAPTPGGKTTLPGGLRVAGECGARAPAHSAATTAAATAAAGWRLSTARARRRTPTVPSEWTSASQGYVGSSRTVVFWPCSTRHASRCIESKSLNHTTRRAQLDVVGSAAQSNGASASASAKEAAAAAAESRFNMAGLLRRRVSIVQLRAVVDPIRPSGPGAPI